MLHFSCDVCGKDLPEEAARYVVKMEAFAATNPAEITDDDLDTDHVEEMAQLLNDIEKHRLGMYAYGFGNVANAVDRPALLEYLLRANSELGIGSFFVDKDGDIGYKFLLDTRDPLSYETFEIVYLAMVNTIKERGPVIAKLAGSGTEPKKPAEEPVETYPYRASEGWR